MASRKEQKEQARADRLAKEQELAAKAGRARRFQIFGGVIAAAVIVIVVAIVISSSGGKSASNSPDTAAAKATYKTVNTLLAGIPQSGTVLGDPKAPVTMTYFGDLQCPICQEFTLDVIPQVVQDLVRTDKVKINYRSFCTATCNPANPTGGTSVFNKQQIAAYAAGKQKLFWEYAELFYHEQGAEDSGYVTEAWLANLAKQIPSLNFKAWETDRSNHVFTRQVEEDNAEATTLQIDGTPALFMTGKKGTQQVEGPNGSLPTYTQLASAAQTVQ